MRKTNNNIESYNVLYGVSQLERYIVNIEKIKNNVNGHPRYNVIVCRSDENNSYNYFYGQYRVASYQAPVDIAHEVVKKLISGQGDI